MTISVQDEVKNYYGEVLQGSEDLKTNACCTDAAMPSYLKAVLSKVHDEVLSRYYGCGLVAPEQLKGMRILDLGSGSGRDCYALSALVGESGYVVGVDMTDAQLEVANRHLDYHRQQFGYTKSNVEFHKGYIEKLDELGFADASFDIIVSNCVINLSSDKEAVLKQAYRLLKPGGEMYFSDVYSDRRVPAELVADPVLYGECLGGALYWHDFIGMAKQAGFGDPRLVESRELSIENDLIKRKLEGIRFYSATYRLFKVLELEPSSENYGQSVIYRGTIEYHPQVFVFDTNFRLPKGEATPVCGNTYRMLKQSRFQQHFDFIGSWDRHLGIFEQAGCYIPFNQMETPSRGCCS
ncbi:MAG: methyltransferase domain-containing protein [Pseudomonadales bacterium]|nr:methyltransferase domain-containing protein [Pseudomonadales bacterium]MCP5216261.1 methyltransferase domain-containing protein [Pseudomonadales bacterium]